ncbi:MAG: autoinducer binding domain-containing protein [Pseudomonadota bacterium]
MFSNHFDDAMNTLLEVGDSQQVLDCLMRYTQNFDIHAFNYGYVDPRGTDEDQVLRLISTADPEWLERYTQQGYGAVDPGVLNMAAGNHTPVICGNAIEEAPPPTSQRQKQFLDEAYEVGWHSGAIIPVRTPAQKPVPLGGIGLVTGLSGSQFMHLWRERQTEFIVLANQVHHAMTPELLRHFENGPRLSARERDCLALIASGLRADRIGDELKIATVTVNFHLRLARQKLGARTTGEAIAKAIRFGQI